MCELLAMSARWSTRAETGGILTSRGSSPSELVRSGPFLAPRETDDRSLTRSVILELEAFLLVRAEGGSSFT